MRDRIRPHGSEFQDPDFVAVPPDSRMGHQRRAAREEHDDQRGKEQTGEEQEQQSKGRQALDDANNPPQGGESGYSRNGDVP